MQNKPNFRKAQMNVSSLITKDYRKKMISQFKKTNPIPERPKMNVNAFLQKDYENEPISGSEKTNPIKANLGAYPNNRVVMRPSEKFKAKAAGQIIQMTRSPLPEVFERGSLHQWDKITLKIYPFGIDCPIVLKEMLFAIYGKDYD